jgi:hypothetical protein
MRQLQRFLALIPEIRAQERLEDAVVGALPYMPRAARHEILGAWTRAARRVVEEPEGVRDRAWETLRTIMRVGG